MDSDMVSKSDTSCIYFRKSCQRFIKNFTQTHLVFLSNPQVDKPVELLTRKEVNNELGRLKYSHDLLPNYRT